MMSTEIVNDEDITEDDMLQRHRKEKKNLQNEITQLKHSVAKTDKKSKKEVQATIAKLENDLQERHRLELERFRSLSIKEGEKTSLNGEDACENLNVDEIEKSVKQIQNETHRTRAQKRRDKKETEAKNRQQALEQSAVEANSSDRAVEKRTFKPILGKRRLKLFEISADGDCMYNAIAHQLSLNGQKYSTQQLRHMASSTIKTNKDEFLPFLLSGDNDSDLMDDEQFDSYCYKVANTTAWGGHVELKALSMALKRRIEVLQASGAPISIGEELQNDNANALTITFHRHAYQLGEHYNSTAPMLDEDIRHSDTE